MKRTINAIRAAWCPDTATPGTIWNANLPVRGQCAVTALLVHDVIGGEILRADVDGSGHYWNAVSWAGEIDLTRAQFSRWVRCSWCVGGGFESEFEPHKHCHQCGGRCFVEEHTSIPRGAVVSRSRLLEGPRAEAARTRERYEQLRARFIRFGGVLP